MKLRKKYLRNIAVGVPILAMLATGCSNNATNTASPAPSLTPTSTAESNEVAYPRQISQWVSGTDYNDIAAFKELEKITGTKVSFQHPPAGQAKDQFNLMIASGELPDIIEYNWTLAPKGADSLIQEKRIIRLNELIDKHAPNLTKVLDDNPAFRKMITTDEGNIYVMPFLLGDESLSATFGPIVREDWLQKLKLKAPTTVAEWETMLTAFRDGDPNGNDKKDEIPLLFNMDDIDLGHFIVGAWGIASTFYQDNGTVKYGPIQPEFKEFLATMARWYKEGLIDPDYITTDAKLKDAKVTNDQLGAFLGYPGGSIGRYIDLMSEKNAQFSLKGTEYPSLNEGGTALGQYSYPFSGIGAAISTSAKNPEQIVKWLDYKYGKEGHLLFNFGIEGESYTMVGDYPTYTDVILHNPDGLSVSEAMAKYFIASWSGPIVQSKYYLEQYYLKQQQRDANKNWSKADHSKQLPPLTLTADESSKTSAIMNDVKTYRDEMINKFIAGVEPLENFDKFVSTIEKMRIDEAIAANQAALERYNSRK
ncbi:ABC transporter substrate-binding protein [Paenibacillus agaridevorans]|uniref:ABC transporter substrate-binding protein n=1 Tax=Paenibacillus agaridevorans TaxID=171404 RepID=A0A2R5EP24_9BACL|nr:extracellular solute-binding protein [Paenibacillus agaridevorans]GBG08440.1 ABC transporter substrate-binding protein [Paenibacillus agaridevorans]